MKTRDTGEVVAVLLPDRAQTKILVTRDGIEILRAVLAPPSQMHRQAAARLLEGLSLWFQRTVRVVLCVDDRCDSSDPSLADAFGLGTSRQHYEVVGGHVEAREFDRARRSASSAGGQTPARGRRRRLGAMLASCAPVAVMPRSA